MLRVTIYNINGETAELYEIDAREAIERHPQEWSYSPWPATSQASEPSA